MTKLLEQAIAMVRALPEDGQDEAAEIMLSLVAKNEAPIALDHETRAAVRQGLGEARQREFVSDEEMAIFFKRHGV